MFFNFRMTSPEVQKNFLYHLYTLEGRPLGFMRHNPEGSYPAIRIGDSIPLDDGTLFGNNSQRLRSCKVVGLVEHHSEDSFILYVRPTFEEVRVYDPSLMRAPGSIDREGEDGWLQHSEAK